MGEPGTMQRYVLVVEDNPDLCFIFAQSFEMAGFKVRSAENATKALQDLHLYSPDILVLDVGLPEMSGLELLRRVRKLHPDMTVIIVTANHLAQEAPEVALADMFLMKPVDINTLITLAERLKMTSRARQSASV